MPRATWVSLDPNPFFLMYSSLVHRAPSYLLVLHGSIAVPPTHLYSAPLGVRLYQVAAHAPFVASFSSFVFWCCALHSTSNLQV